jgi:hypothetical protein
MAAVLIGPTTKTLTLSLGNLVMSILSRWLIHFNIVRTVQNLNMYINQQDAQNSFD